MNLQHLPTSVNSHQDITLHILMAHRLQAMSKHNQIQVWFLNFFLLPNNQYRSLFLNHGAKLRNIIEKW